MGGRNYPGHVDGEEGVVAGEQKHEPGSGEAERTATKKGVDHAKRRALLRRHYRHVMPARMVRMDSPASWPNSPDEASALKFRVKEEGLTIHEDAQTVLSSQ